MAVTDDVGGDTRWMTYAELAEARGIREPAAVRLVQRRKWERQPGNDGSTRIAVPLAELRPLRLVAPAVRPVGGDSTDVAPDKQQVEGLARERHRADQAEARAEQERHRADHAEGKAAELLLERDAARQEREEARVQGARAAGEAGALREALDEARRPAWRRWLGFP